MQQGNEHSGVLEIARNVILVISTVAVLGILIAGYWMFTGGARGANGGPTRFETRLPDSDLQLPSEGGSVGEIRSPVGMVEIPGGRAAGMTVFDERTGEPVFRFSLDSYSPVPGSINEIFCTKPELTQRLPGGMVATVSADEARIVAERSGSNIRPRSGRMTGNCVITVDRAARDDAAPLRDRPHDRVVIEMDHFDFDLNLGVMRTDAAVQAVSREFEIGGIGLELNWNQALNRIDKLEIQQGHRLVLHLARGLADSLGASGPAAAPEAASQPGPDAVAATPAGGHAAPAEAPPVAPGPDRKRPATGYACTLGGPISAEHYRDRSLTRRLTHSTRVGRLEASSLQLLFDMGGDAGRLLTRGTREDGPAEPREHLIVNWDGPLTLLPAASPPGADKPRRRIDALGPVTLTVPDGTIEAGELTLHQDVDRMWLRADEDGFVHIRLSGMHATASGVFHDGAAGTLKLIGPVRVRPTDSGSRERVAIRCAHWAELSLDPGANADGVELGAASTPRRVTFVGDVLADLGEEQLRANELIAHFVPSGSAPDLGGVMATGSDRLERIQATGAVRLTSGTRWLTCWRLDARLATGDDGTVYARQVTADGFVRLVDRQRRVQARGRELIATMLDRRQLDQATVFGGPDDPADLLAEDYLVRGNAIDFYAPRQSMEVKGRSELVFRSTRGLRGLRQTGDRLTRIESQQRLLVDLRDEHNIVQFAGEVHARNGDEELLADSLTLHLRNAVPEAGPLAAQDVAPSAARIGAALLGPSGSAALRATRSGLRFADESRTQIADWRRAAAGGTAPPRAMAVERAARKEAVRLVARNAVVQSNTHVPAIAAGQRAADRPALHQSLAAPEIDVDLPQRILRTVGGTSLYMIDRRLNVGSGEAAGAPSALVSGGPSQTVMRCERSLTYSFGPEGPERSDRVLLEGGVRFRRVTGDEMVNPETMVPAGSQGAAAAIKLEDRNTYLESERLEIELISEPQESRAGRSPLALGWIGASGDAYLRDQRGDQVRSVEADRLEFDRRFGLVRILGEGRPARVYNENRRTAQLDLPVVGPEIIIDLKANTVSTKRIEGTIRR